MDYPHSNNPELPEGLRQKRTPPSPVPTDALRRALQLPITPSQPVQPPEQDSTCKLQGCVISGRKLLDNNKATKDSILQWARRVRTALLPVFGRDAKIVKDLDILVKDAQSRGLSREQFTERLEEVQSLVDYLKRAGEFPLACPVSHTSRVPSTKDVFII